MAEEIGGANRGRCREGYYASFLECDKSRNVKSKIVIIFFLGRSAELYKTFPHRPRPIPIAEAPEGGVG